MWKPFLIKQKLLGNGDNQNPMVSIDGHPLIVPKETGAVVTIEQAKLTDEVELNEGAASNHLGLAISSATSDTSEILFDQQWRGSSSDVNF